MRSTLFRSLAPLTVAAGLLSAGPSQAQTFDPRYPVCLHVYSGSSGGGGDWYDCSFTSLPQCRATAAGQSAICDINPYFSAAAPPRPRQRRPG